MRTAYFDCFSGISGDMALGALTACGVDQDELRQELTRLNLSGWDIQFAETEQNGIGANDVTVQVTEEQRHGRHLYHIEEILSNSNLPESVTRRSFEAFTHLANAEAKIHQTTPDRIHFHEVGAVDAIVDIVGSVICIEKLGIERIISSPLPMGRGFVECMHGTIPIPAPATLELTREIPVYGVDIEGELVTPTGAALVKTLAAGFGPMPAMSVMAQGFGAGKKRFGDKPNLLRVVVGESGESDTAAASGVVVLETNLDDFNPQFFEVLSDRLFDSGALDVFLTPVQMKKGRPGTQLTVLSPPRIAELLAGLIFRETSTLGVRKTVAERFTSDREWTTVTTAYGEVRIKSGRWRGEETTASPEYEDVKRLAIERGVPIKRVYSEAMESYMRDRK